MFEKSRICQNVQLQPNSFSLAHQLYYDT